MEDIVSVFCLVITGIIVQISSQLIIEYFNPKAGKKHEIVRKIKVICRECKWTGIRKAFILKRCPQCDGRVVSVEKHVRHR
jgi:DnaJ-class molecular chaperone